MLQKNTINISNGIVLFCGFLKLTKPSYIRFLNNQRICIIGHEIPKEKMFDNNVYLLKNFLNNKIIDKELSDRIFLHTGKKELFFLEISNNGVTSYVQY